MKYIIIDWANNVCFNGQEFDSFEDGWGFLYETFPNGDEDNTFDDYSVVYKSETRSSNYIDPNDVRNKIKVKA